MGNQLIKDFLNNGGYYFALNDYIDLSLIGDIYSKGSWNLRAISNYKKRYRYNGNFNLSYSKLKTGSKLLDNITERRDFFIKWMHQQDPKASLNNRFSANINIGSSTFQQNNSLSDKDYLSNTYSSNISYSKKWQSSNFSLNLRHSQNTLTRKIDLNLPEFSYSINRFYPFKKLNNTNKSKWYDKISINYNSNFKNSISIADSLIFNKSTISKFRNGVLHSIPISTSFTTLKYINLSPSFSYKERWYFDRIEKKWSNNELITDTLNGFYRAFNYSYSLLASTKIYGTLKFNNTKIKGIRHVMSPSISLSYTPDFSNNKFNFYDNVQIDSLGNNQEYSYYQNGIYGFPSSQSNSSIRFSLGNIIENENYYKGYY